jgi:uncharacterized membrane protein
MILGIVLLVGLLLYVTPRVARPGLFFGVTVDSAFAGSDAARRIKRRYGLEIVLHSAIALALAFALGPAVGLLWQVFGGGWAFANAHRAAMPYGSGESAIREAGLDPQPEDSLFVTALALAPLTLLLLLALYARSHWDQIPDRFPVHFGFHGPDRWVTRSPRAVYGLIVLNGLLCGLMLMTRYGLRHGSRRVAIDGAPAQAEARFRRIITWLLVAAEYLMVMLTWAILFSSPQGVFVFGIGMLVLTVVLVFVLMRMGQGGSRLAPGSPGGDRTPDACWKWGMFYVNPSDPALFVEKRFGIGYTVNFGNRWSWIFLVITLLPLIAVTFYLR